MTGFGNATQHSASAHVSVELKAVNNRYLKVTMRLPDFVARFEAQIEKLIREEISRGSVQLSFRIKLSSETSGYSIDRDVLRNYAAQLHAFHASVGLNNTELPGLADMLTLPGVVTEAEVTSDVVESVWPVMQSTLREALQHFHDFRGQEGESMRQDLQLQCRTIETQVDQVETQAPVIIDEYRDKLLERVRRAFAESEVEISEKDVIREVAVFADRCDINEEITRLRSHIDQFRRFLDSETSMGRKLEFLGQEMFREINTIGSKANNVTVAHSVVEMKAAIERIREVLQNVE